MDAEGRDVDAVEFLRQVVSPEYYRSRYRDVAGDPVEHFVRTGHAEGRIPAAAWERLAPAVELRRQASDTPLIDIVDLLPAGRRRALTRDKIWERLLLSTHPRFYAAQFPELGVLDVAQAATHFLGRGAFSGARPGIFYNAEHYRARLRDLTGGEVAASTHPFLHWLTEGWDARVVPTQLFDADYFHERHPRLQPRARWVFAHYLRDGAYRPGWRPSPWVEHPPVAVPGARAAHAPLLVDRFLSGADPAQLRTEVPLERDAGRVAAMAQRLERPVLGEMIARAREIEPLIGHPPGIKDVHVPPLRTHTEDLYRAAEGVRRALALPADGSAGRDRCGQLVVVATLDGVTPSYLTELLGQADAGEQRDVLVVVTGAPHAGEAVVAGPPFEVLHLTEAAERLGPDYRVRLLLDVVRGLAPERVVNAGSALAWDLFAVFGSQLCALTRLEARIVGPRYPELQLEDALPSLDRVVVVDDDLREELVRRYAFSADLERRILPPEDRR